MMRSRTHFTRCQGCAQDPAAGVITGRKTGVSVMTTGQKTKPNERRQGRAQPCAQAHCLGPSGYVPVSLALAVACQAHVPLKGGNKEGHGWEELQGPEGMGQQCSVVGRAGGAGEGTGREIRAPPTSPLPSLGPSICSPVQALTRAKPVERGRKISWPCTKSRVTSERPFPF